MPVNPFSLSAIRREKLGKDFTTIKSESWRNFRKISSRITFYTTAAAEMLIWNSNSSIAKMKKENKVLLHFI